MSGANPSSTGLVLLALSTFDDSSAENVYNGLMVFKVDSIPGAFHSSFSSDPDPDYSTPDALEGLLAYSHMLSGSPSIYDLSSYSNANDPVDDTTLEVEKNLQLTDFIPYIIILIILVAVVFIFIITRKKNRKS